MIKINLINILLEIINAQIFVWFAEQATKEASTGSQVIQVIREILIVAGGIIIVVTILGMVFLIYIPSRSKK